MPPKNKILLLNGPNLNLLGQREHQHYGRQTLQELIQELQIQAQNNSIELETIQSNAEHVLIEAIQQTQAHFILINAGAYTHTSIAIRDALLAINTPFIEVHLSNVYARESFRHHSMLSDIAYGSICGLGSQSYSLALSAATHYLSTQTQ